MEQQSRWLLAWMNEEEAIPALLGRPPAPDENTTESRRVWHDSRAALMHRGPYRQTTPALSKLPGNLKKQATKFRQRPDVIADLDGQDYTVGMIDLRKVLSLQRVVEENALQRAQEVIPNDPDSLFSFCLPQPGLGARVSGTLDQVNRAITLTSLNWNFRIGNPLIVDIDVSPGPGQSPRKEKHIGFTVGFGTPFVHVVECNSRCAPARWTSSLLRPAAACNPPHTMRLDESSRFRGDRDRCPQFFPLRNPVWRSSPLSYGFPR